MNTLSTLDRILAAIAAPCTTTLMLIAVVSLSEPPPAAGGPQLASATAVQSAPATVRR